jgi:hypothetical protein
MPIPSNQELLVWKWTEMCIGTYWPRSDSFWNLENAPISLFTETDFEMHETKSQFQFNRYYTQFSESSQICSKSLGIEYDNSQINTTWDIVWKSTTIGLRQRSGISPRTFLDFQLRPYIAESTGSRPISKVKLLMAGLVVPWETRCESSVL